jgi:ribosomal protein S18 acetylase RimI-like enzyme
MIRDACTSDFDGILNLERQVFQIHLNARPDMIKPLLPFNQDYFEQCLQDEKKRIYVFEENGSILGYCITIINEYKDNHLYFDHKVLEINDMCVDEKVRGRGIGRQFVDRAKQYAKEVEATRLELMVWSFNRDVRQFYEHLGFSERISRMEMHVE